MSMAAATMQTTPSTWELEDLSPIMILESNDGKTFEISKNAAKLSLVLRAQISEDDEDEDEDANEERGGEMQSFPIPKANGKTLELVVA